MKKETKTITDTEREYIQIKLIAEKLERENANLVKTFTG